MPTKNPIHLLVPIKAELDIVLNELQHTRGNIKTYIEALPPDRVLDAAFRDHSLTFFENCLRHISHLEVEITGIRTLLIRAMVEVERSSEEGQLLP